MLDIEEHDIDRRCGHGATEAGRRYHRQARVVEFSREGDTIRSAVKGSERAPYRQTIALTEGRRGGVDIAGRCTCPVATNCKHVAAALFHAMTVASGARAAAIVGPGTPAHARPQARPRRGPTGPRPPRTPTSRRTSRPGSRTSPGRRRRRARATRTTSPSA